MCFYVKGGGHVNDRPASADDAAQVFETRMM